MLESTAPFLPRPVRVRHANPDLPVVFTEDVKGGRRSVADLTELYALSAKVAKLQEYVTIVNVADDGTGRFDYMLINATNVANSSGWLKLNTATVAYTKTEIDDFFSGTTAITGYNKTEWDYIHSTWSAVTPSDFVVKWDDWEGSLTVIGANISHNYDGTSFFYSNPGNNNDWYVGDFNNYFSGNGALIRGYADILTLRGATNSFIGLSTSIGDLDTQLAGSRIVIDAYNDAIDVTASNFYWNGYEVATVVWVDNNYYPTSNPASYIDESYLVDYVTLGTSQSITGDKDFTGSLRVNNLSLVLKNVAENGSIQVSYSGVSDSFGIVEFPSVSDATTEIIAYRNWVDSRGFLTSSALTNYVTLTTTQTISGTKTFSDLRVTNTTGLQVNNVDGTVRLRGDNVSGDGGDYILKTDLNWYGNVITDYVLGIGLLIGNFTELYINGDTVALQNWVTDNYQPLENQRLSETDSVLFANISISSGGVLYLNDDLSSIRGTTTSNEYYSQNGNHKFFNSTGAVYAEILAGSFKVNGGTSTGFLKANGSVDSNTYITSAALSDYVTRTTAQTITGEKTFTRDITAAGIVPEFITIVGSGSITASNSGGIILNTLGVGNVILKGDNTAGVGLDGGDYIFKTNMDYYGNVITDAYLTNGNAAANFNSLSIQGYDVATQDWIYNVINDGSMYADFFTLKIQGDNVATQDWVNSQDYITAFYTGFDSRYLGLTATAANSTKWNGFENCLACGVQGADGSMLPIGIRGDGLVLRYTAAAFQSMLGLGSNAYTSTAYLPTAGGTMTGALSGTSATFSGQVTSGGVKVDDGTNGVYQFGSNGKLLYTPVTTSNTNLYFRYNGTDDATILNSVNYSSYSTFNGDIKGRDIIVSRGSGVGGMFVSNSIGGATGDIYLYFDGTTWKVGGGDAGYAVLLHAQNIGSYALPLAGGTLTGALSGTSATFSSGVYSKLLSANNGTIAIGFINDLVGGDAGTGSYGVGDSYIQTSTALRIGTSTAKRIAFVTNGWNNERFIINPDGSIFFSNSVTFNNDGYFGGAVQSNTFKNSAGTTILTFNASTNYSTFYGELESRGIFYHRSNLNVLNKAVDGWLTWASRNTTGSEVKIDLSNIGSITASSYMGVNTNKKVILDSESDNWSYVMSSDGSGDVPVSGLILSSNNATTHVWSAEDNDYGTIKSAGFVLNAGTSSQVLKANGSVSTHAELIVPAVRVNDANYTATIQNELIEFHSLTADRDLTLPNPASMSGKRIIISNELNSGYFISYAGSYIPKFFDDSSYIKTGTTERCILYSDGVNWILISTNFIQATEYCTVVNDDNYVAGGNEQFIIVKDNSTDYQGVELPNPSGLAGKKLTVKVVDPTVNHYVFSGDFQPYHTVGTIIDPYDDLVPTNDVTSGDLRGWSVNMVSDGDYWQIVSYVMEKAGA